MAGLALEAIVRFLTVMAAKVPFMGGGLVL